MPTTESGYVSLETGNGFRSVYNATTEPASNDGNSVIKSVKRVIGQAIGGGNGASPPLIADTHR